MPAIDPFDDTVGDVEKKKKNPVQDRPEATQVTRKPSPLMPQTGGYTPSPISPYIAAPNPAPATAKSMTQRLLDVQYYAPNLADKPSMAMAIAMDPHVSVAEIRTIAAIESAVTKRLHLEGLDPQMQLDVFDNLNRKQQSALWAIGYRTPNPEDLPVDSEDGGLFGWFKGAREAVTGFVGDRANDALDAFIPQAGQDMFSDALDAGKDGAAWVGDSPAAMGISDSAVGDAAASAGGFAKKVWDNTSGKLIDAGMYALSEPQELVFQDLRAFRLLQGDDLSFGSLKDIQEAFDIAEEGNRAFDKDYLSEAQSKINDDEMYRLAVEVQSLPPEEQKDWAAQKVEEAGKSGGPEAAQAMWAKLQSTQFGDAMGLVDAAHISVGRMIAQDYGLANMDDADFNFISGSIDFTARVTLDPWLLAGAAGKGAQAARYGISGVSRVGVLGRKVEDMAQFQSRVGEIFRLKATRRWWEGASPTANNGALKHINIIRDGAKVHGDEVVADATRRLERYNGVDDTMNQALIQADKSVVFRNADDVEEFVKSVAGRAAVFTGKSAFRYTKLQKKNMLEHWVAQTKPGKVVDWLDRKAGVGIADLGQSAEVKKALDLLPEAERAAAAEQMAKQIGSIVNQAWKKKPWYRASTMLTRLTTHVPVPKEGKLFLDDPSSVHTITQMARTFGPRSWADGITAAYTTANEAGRRSIYKGMMQTLGEASGMTRTAEGKAALERAVSNAVDENYTSLTRADDMGDGTKAGIFAHQLRPYVSMPEFSTMHAQAQRMGVLSHLGGYFTRDGADWFVQRVFKPSVLLRPALVLRNAGEEVLRHVVDNGARSYVEGRMLRTHLRGGAARKGGVRDPMLDDEWRFFRLFTKPAWAAYEKGMNAVARGGRGTATRMQARSARDWFVGGHIASLRRAFLTKTVGKDVIEAAEDLWDNYPRFRKLYSTEVMDNSRRAFVGNVEDLRGGRGWLGAHASGRRSGTIQYKGKGGFQTKAVEGHDGAIRWTMQLDKIAHDDFGRIAVENLLDEERAIALIKEELATNPVAMRAVAAEKLGIDKWAQRIYDETKFHFVGQNGRFQRRLYDHLVPEDELGGRIVATDKFNVDEVNDLVPDVDNRPIHVNGQDVIHYERDTAGLISRIVDGGFDYIGDSTNYISRGPLFFSNMIGSLKDGKPYYHAILDGEHPVEVVAAHQKQVARSVIHDADGNPVTFHHGSETKHEALSAQFANKASNEYVVGVEFVEDSAEAARFAGPRSGTGDDFIDGFDPEARTGHVHTVWIKQGKMLDVHEDLDPDEWEGLLVQFAKKAGLDDNWVTAQKFKAASSGRFRLDDFYQDAVAKTRTEPGTLFHGSGKALTDDMLDGSYSYGRVGDQARNLVGPGFYTTDARTVAKKYTRKGVTENATVHHVEWKGDSPPRLMDMDEAVGDDFLAAVDESLGQYVSAEELRGMTGMQAYQRVKDTLEHEGVTSAEADEVLFGLSHNLGARGYDGFKHVGGKYASKSGEQHNVTVFFDQSKVGVRVAGPDLEGVNEALEGALKSKKYKGFTRNLEGKKITHVINDDYILPNRFPPVSKGRINKFAREQYYRVAEQRALERTISFVDNPVMRSQFSVIARNLFPFWRAQEEFYRRWARTFKHSPEAFRKAQLMMMGFEHSGFVQKDDAGHSYFVYPFLGEATEAFRRFGERMGINLGEIPQVTQYSGQIRFLNQGIDPNNIQPSVSPLLGLPISVMADMWPELQSVENFALGEQGSGRNPYWAALPTPLRRLAEAGAFGQDGEWTAQMLSAGQTSIAALESAGLTPPDDASAAEIDAYLERVREYTKFTLSARAVWGALAPTPLDRLDPSAELPEHLQFDGVRTFDQQFQSMINEMGYEKAMTLWLETNPDQVPYAVGKTESASGAFWNSTQKAADFYDANKPLFEKYPKAATFLFPLDPSGEWDPDVFAKELASGIRVRKDIGSFYRDVKLAGTLTEYYNSADNVSKAVAAAKEAGDYPLAEYYQNDYDNWADKFRKRNPLVDEYISFGQHRAYERDQTVNEMRDLLKEAPTSEATTVISDLIGSYDNYRKYIAANPGSTTIAEQNRKLATQSWQDYMSDTAKTNDNAWLFYNKTFRWME